MVHGRQGLKLELGKFGVYLAIPILASVAFNEPKIQRVCADYFQFLKYPANPNTRLKEEFEELVQKRDLEKKQRQEYAEQIQKLQESAKRSRIEADGQVNSETRKGWFKSLFRRG
mmetsp:Transcript_9313/g.13222  ORF Transcript_9313/g.13222 Transcript_9313/m.13222 type:complete len:115 (+) Transcript_9313:89-433(+)|eukprot:CAMPEP_0184854842 /NCGR_PEP_ID=MMETSP0580-20130426/224_1 /TAXON_ID=1118495 /ORGANISM="Dactyliosolen fragilissimus" /LENGTH=114 /DNA_ID=CAMNT_0027349189 /DNA_START=69 /DNA_END=413 /DNA_ORIENTATION=+